MVSSFQHFRRKMLLPAQIFIALFLLGVWMTTPKIEEDLTERANAIIKELGVAETVRVKFDGPVATLRGEVPEVSLRTQLVERIESLESLWGLRVEDPNSLQVIIPVLPVSYRLDFASREIKLSGNLPGELEKKALLRKTNRLFPGASVMDQTVIPELDRTVANASRASLANPMGMWLNFLDELPNLNSIGQLRWVTVEDGRIVISANLPSEAARKTFDDAVKKIDINASTAELKLIATPMLEIKFGPNQTLTVSGKLGAAADEPIAMEFLKGLFPKSKVEAKLEFDETLGPVEWLFPQFQPLPGLQKLGKLTRFVASGEVPILEAETMTASDNITLSLAVDEAYKKQVKANVTVTSLVVTTITPPNMWATQGEEATDVAGTVAEEAGKTLMIEKLQALFPATKFNFDIAIDAGRAPTRLYLPVLDPIVDLINLEPSFILQGFGIVEGRLKFTGVVPDTGTKDRLTGIVLKRHVGRVSADITVDPAYAPSPDALWEATFADGKMTLSGQVSSKRLKADLMSDLQTAFPKVTVENGIEVIPSGLRKGEWNLYLPGLPVVAAWEQLYSLQWKGNQLKMSVRVASDTSRETFLARLRRTFGQKVVAEVHIDSDPKFAALPGPLLTECTIYFQPSQKDFMTQELPTLQRVFDLLSANPELQISIEGHTDDKGSFNGNLNTSLMRAETVRKWLGRRGIDEARIAVQGYGPKRPVGDFKTEEGRAANRRLDFRVR